MQIRTKKGYDLYVIASALQKSIRRGDAKLACYCGLELFHSGYYKYAWKRLLTIAAEDIHDCVSKEIWALLESFNLLREKIKKGEESNKGRIFIVKAILILCRGKKSRDADHASNLYYDVCNIPEIEIKEYIEDSEEIIVMPDYVYDIHTIQGKRMGKTKKNFFVDEFKALKPKALGVFDNLVFEWAKNES